MLVIEPHWYRRSALSLVLLPVSRIYCALVSVRRALYRAGVLPSVRLPVPVIVVGNITVGGTGKTPLVIWLVHHLAGAGFRPGIVTRGYGGEATDWPRLVQPGSDPGEVGDEPVLMARRAGCPVMADPDRVRAARRLFEAHDCNVIVSDDGLQHYRLARDIEIAVIDGVRRFGNGRCLPAGPLREPPSRLKTVDACVTQGPAATGEFAVVLAESGLHTPDGMRPADTFRGQRVHAVAGIGHPARFFEHLRHLGMDVMEHPFPDHHAYTDEDFDFAGDGPVIMTEKDAVKCERLNIAPFSFLVVEARPDPELGELIVRKLKEVAGG